MSLMAAVTASGESAILVLYFCLNRWQGILSKETQLAFVEEVGRVGRDNVYWVRREASFALGALAKVVPEEVVINSLVCPFFEGPHTHLNYILSYLFLMPYGGMEFGTFGIQRSLHFRPF